MQPTQQRFSLRYFILVFIGLLVIQALRCGPHTENLSYRDFEKILKAGKVGDLAIGAHHHWAAQDGGA